MVNVSAAGIGAISYGLGALVFALFTVLLVTAWRGRLQGGLLLLASGGSALWCTLWSVDYLGLLAVGRTLWIVEVVRAALWILLLSGLLGLTSEGAKRPEKRQSAWVGRLALWGSLGLAVVVGAQWVMPSDMSVWAEGLFAPRYAVLGLVGLAVAGLVWVEQVYRNTPQENRWALKPLCLGIGGCFAFDFYLYSDALLFGRLDQDLVLARGAVNALVVPFLAVAASRSSQWSVEIFVSRQIVFHSAAVLGAGVYLIGMAAVGYYIRAFGGTLATVFQTVFFFGAALLLFLLLFSGQVRGKAKVFLNKHFFKNRYDYREEWLRFTYALSTSKTDTELRENILRATAQIVDSNGGAMWVRQNSRYFIPMAVWNLRLPDDAVVREDHPLTAFLTAQEWIISLPEFAASPEQHAGLKLPAWLNAVGTGWLLVPLKERDELLGFILLTESTSITDLDWEIRDLMKTVGRQAAGYLALLQATAALSDARQFEAFNRLSAFVVHDLNNLAAQLTLISANSQRFRGNPEFEADTLETVQNVTARMNRLLDQLRKGRIEDTTSTFVAMRPVVDKVIRLCAARSPVPRCSRLDEGALWTGDPETLTTILEHLVKNAQEATPDNGTVNIEVKRQDNWLEVSVIDTGCGMDARFVSDRLFRPFDTTKGNAGMGIGVYESREFARAASGELEVETEPGRGTTFTMRLPCDAAEDGPMADLRAAAL